LFISCRNLKPERHAGGVEDIHPAGMHNTNPERVSRAAHMGAAYAAKLLQGITTFNPFPDPHKPVRATQNRRNAVAARPIVAAAQALNAEHQARPGGPDRDAMRRGGVQIDSQRASHIRASLCLLSACRKPISAYQ
jgi:hypothetical protein